MGLSLDPWDFRMEFVPFAWTKLLTSDVRRLSRIVALERKLGRTGCLTLKRFRSLNSQS